jgi:hypothetical protein
MNGGGRVEGVSSRDRLQDHVGEDVEERVEWRQAFGDQTQTRSTT